MKQGPEFLEGVIKQFEYYKLLGEKAMNQLSPQELFMKYNEESNSIAVIVNHLAGNMLSRWTDFLTTDGEKDSRNRDLEFEDVLHHESALMQRWSQGWECLFTTLHSLSESDLQKIVYIRNQGHTVVEAIHRQLAHYPYHVGQIVYAAKMLCNGNWESLSIPKGHSSRYNAEKFGQEKTRMHFTNEYLESQKSPFKTERFVHDWLAAWSGTVDELLTYYHPQASYCDPSLTEPLVGHHNLHGYFSALLQKFHGWKWELVELVDHPQIVTLKWKATFIINGQEVVTYGMDIVELYECKIIRNEVYFDRPDFLRTKGYDG